RVSTDTGRAAGARAGRRNARQTQPARQRHHQGRDPAAVRDPAARDTARVVRAVAWARAAACAAGAYPRAPPGRPVAARSAARAARNRAARDVVQRSAHAPRTEHGAAEALYRRSRASDENAARRAAYPGRAGIAPERVGGGASLARTDRDEFRAGGAARHAVARARARREPPLRADIHAG